MLITTDQNAGFSGKINAINIYSFPQFFNLRRHGPDIPKFRCFSSEITPFTCHILLCILAE